MYGQTKLFDESKREEKQFDDGISDVMQPIYCKKHDFWFWRNRKTDFGVCPYCKKGSEPMKIADIYPSVSTYMNKEDVETLDGKILTVKKVEIKEVGKGESARNKPIIHFEETDKTLVGNKTNCKEISLYAKSDDTDDWEGTKFALFVDDSVEYEKKPTGGIRVVPYKVAMASQKKKAKEK